MPACIITSSLGSYNHIFSRTLLFTSENLRIFQTFSSQLVIHAPSFQMPSSPDNTPALSPELRQFQLAIESLPAATLRSEVQRLHNSTFHLRRSNTELAAAADEDEELREYIQENEQVIISNNMRISLLENQLRRVDPSFEGTDRAITVDEALERDSGNTAQGFERRQSAPTREGQLDRNAQTPEHTPLSSETSELTELLPATNGRVPNGSVNPARSEEREQGEGADGVFL